MVGENEAILRRWIEDVWNKGLEKTIEELFSENGVAICPINPPDNPIRGVEGFRAFLRQTKQVFSDIKVTVEDAVEEGEKVVAFCWFSANRRERNLDGTTKESAVSVSGLCQIKVRDGKIYDAWNNFDLLNAE